MILPISKCLECRRGAGSGLASLAVAAWQFANPEAGTDPDPDKVSGWQERDIYLCALIIACATIAWMGRWIAVKFMQRDKESLEVVKRTRRACGPWLRR